MQDTNFKHSQRIKGLKSLASRVWCNKLKTFFLTLLISTSADLAMGRKGQGFTGHRQ